MICDYKKDGYCHHPTGTNGSRQLPCIFNTHDTRIEKCRYLLNSNNTQQQSSSLLFGKVKCNKPNCPGVTNCSCNWRG